MNKFIEIALWYLGKMIIYSPELSCNRPRVKMESHFKMIMIITWMFIAHSASLLLEILNLLKPLVD